MIDESLTNIFSSQWRVVGIVSLLLVGASETGFWVGLRLYRAKDEARKGQISGVQGAVLGLLERPRRGLIRISQEPMLDLKASLSQPTQNKAKHEEADPGIVTSFFRPRCGDLRNQRLTEEPDRKDSL